MSRKSKRVLIVDDSKDFSELLAEFVEDCHFSSQIANSSKEALQLAQDIEFDGMVIDILLPDIMGTTLIKKLKEQGYHKPIIVCSGFVSEELLNRNKDPQITAVLSKPFEEAEFKRSLTQAIS